MSEVQKIKPRYLVSIAPFVKKLGLKEGDYLLLEEKDGCIILRPVDLVPRDNLTKNE